MTLRTLNYGNYGIFLMTGFCPSTVLRTIMAFRFQLQGDNASPKQLECARILGGSGDLVSS